MRITGLGRPDVTPVVFAQRGANLHARIASAFFALRFVGFEVVSK